MNRISRTIAVVAMVAVLFHGSVSTLAAETTIDGIVEVPCDPSRVSEVAFVLVRPVSGESVTTVIVDSSTGRFRESGFTPGDYDFVVIGMDGKPLVPEPTKLEVVEGLNAVVLTMQPPGCGEQGSVGAPGEEKPGEKKSLKDWQLSLIYVGVVGAIILALYDDDDEPASSPSQP
jgi:hypothetical protein